MGSRKIIYIDASKCNGCKACIPNCPEGAIQMIDGKARLISDLFCDGLGACIGHCPQGAITIEEREAGPYDERKVMENIIPQGNNVIAAHLAHLKDHGQAEYFSTALALLRERNISIEGTASACHGSSAGGCPGSRMIDMRRKDDLTREGKKPHLGQSSQLRQWPIQLMLVPAVAPYLDGAHILIAADCVPFAYANFHEDLLKGKILLVGCPKLDDTGVYQEKLAQIFQRHRVKSVTYAHMEVPCCFGLVGIIQNAIESSGKAIPFEEVTIGIQGERLS